MVKNLPANAGDIGNTGFDPWEDPVEEMATHSSILAWKISLAEEPCGLYSQWGCKDSDMTEQLSRQAGN